MLFLVSPSSCITKSTVPMQQGRSLTHFQLQAKLFSVVGKRELFKFVAHQNFNLILYMSLHYAIIPAEAAIKYDFTDMPKQKKQINM